MSGHEGFARQLREGDHVIKLMEVQHPANASLIAAMVTGGESAMDAYLATLRAAGVTLPADLAVISASPLAVRHRWVTGLALLDQAGDDQERFVSAITEITHWLRMLDPADARIDTNLANFVLADGRVVLVDVLPPLIPSLNAEPSNLFEQMFSALCFDTTVILQATIGYAARAMLGSAKRVAASQVDVLTRQLRYGTCPGQERAFPASWFSARAELALHALAGDAQPEIVKSFFALTSVRVFRELPEASRARRVTQVAAAIRELGAS